MMLAYVLLKKKNGVKFFMCLTTHGMSKGQLTDR